MFQGSSKYLLRRTHTVSSLLQFLIDVAIIECLLWYFSRSLETEALQGYHFLTFVTPVVMWFLYRGVYRMFPGEIYRALSILWAWSKVVALLLVLLFFSNLAIKMPRDFILHWYVFSTFALMLAHYAINYINRHYIGEKIDRMKAVIVGDTRLGSHLVENINNNKWLSHKVVGVLNDSSDQVLHVDSVPHLGGYDSLRPVVEKFDIKRIYFSLPIHDTGLIKDMETQVLDLNIDIVWVPDIFSFHLLNPSIREQSGLPLCFLSESPLNGCGRYVKCAFDKVFSFLAVILLSPVMIAIAIAIKISSPGPVFFKQLRHGLDGKVFSIIKFRSMNVHQDPDGGVSQAKKNDSRVTPIGAFIRKTSIDELPQLFNVLKGDMSLVGPRPHATTHNHYYSNKIDMYMSRHRVLPGMTGLAQVRGFRGETETLEKMKQRVELDMVYINNWSIRLDVGIIIRTAVALLKPSHNAY